MGPLFTCIIKTQFEDLRDGDRFFFSYGVEDATCLRGPIHPFAKGKIRGRSLRAIFCNNLEPTAVLFVPFFN